MVSPQNNIWETGLKIVTAIVANATNSFSLATKNSGLVAMHAGNQISLRFIFKLTE